MGRQIKLNSIDEAQLLYGPYDENIKLIEKELGIRVRQHSGHLEIRGNSNKARKAFNIIAGLLSDIRSGSKPLKSEVYYLLKGMKSSNRQKRVFMNNIEEKLSLNFQGKQIGPKTKGQTDYVRAIRDYDIVFGIGPAGTGKTYLAMAMAVEALKNAQVRRIILTRPAIEAGESLGYLPGDMYEKISPYLRPLYDALYDMMDAERIEKYLEMGVIEVAPLGFMRGRTLNDAFIILDEAQNCTTEQMKMFLTRLGFDSKTVITGDITQSDLPGGRPAGLIQAQGLLKKINGIKFISFSGSDVVRHELVQRIIEAYEKTNKNSDK